MVENLTFHKFSRIFATNIYEYSETFLNLMTSWHENEFGTDISIL